MQLARTASIPISPPKSIILHSANSRRDWRSDAVEKSVISVANLGNFVRTRSLIRNASSTGGVTEVQRPVADEPRSVRVEVRTGKPLPFGATACDGGVNFAIFSSGASSATLCLFSVEDLRANTVTEEIPLDPLINKTGDVWHVFLEGEIEDMLYGYKFDGKFCPEEGHYFDSSRVLLDPYAKAVISREEYGVLGPDGNCWPQMAGMIPLSNNEFDWEGDLPLCHPQKDLIIYEMHVRGYTKHDSSKTDFPGTYLGAVDKLDHLKELGVNCIELMPSQEFNELEYFNYSSVPGESNSAEKKEYKRTFVKDLPGGFSPVKIHGVSRRRLLSESIVLGLAIILVSPEISMALQETKDPEIIRYQKLNTGVKIQDIIEGEGPEAHEGDVVEVNYVCRRSNGYFVHSTVDQFSGESQPVILPLDGKEIIQGLKEVLVGMKVGGKRRALIPPSVGYVSENLKPIPEEFGPRRSLLSHANEPLVFEVQLLKVL